VPVSDYIVTIGLEVHCQIKTNTKMFCGCKTSFADEPNTHTCPTCLGLPGALPVLNEFAIERTILSGMLLGCSTPPTVVWDRKNYFYPDMPKDYQITQMDLPLCLGGGVPLYDHNYPKDAQKNIPNPGKIVELNRIHLEEDVAKSTHLANSTLIDFNRAGTPLMEIVTEPDLDSAEETFAYLKSLQQILIAGGISDADMDKGQMRCDVNISVRKNPEDNLGTKIELKNMNSTSAVRRAIYYEVARQCEALDNGDTLVQATWRWDEDLGETQEMRTKENAHDYRYFPDPDLLPVTTAAYVKKVRPLVPELPHEKSARFQEELGLTPYDASVITSDIQLVSCFEATVQSAKAPGKKVANWIINNLLGLLNEKSVEIKDSPVTPEKLAEILNLIEAGTVSNSQAKELFTALWEAPEKDPTALAKEMGFEPADTGAIDALIDEVIADNPDKVAEIQGGNDKLLNFLTGQVMKASKGKANPKIVTEGLRDKLL
jgi:aspartyl-tRNA(Asn)/glutamyl-tRNA(Gln) amidotransferase subunit B|tara:strand:+ start:2733 stop:4196 length:1464 start_codon:yes stop_codon:yes gene_type:complete